MLNVGRFSRLATAAAVAGVMSVGAASAATTITFDEDQSDPYFEQGFRFTPITFSDSNNCDEPACPHQIKEMVMTYMGPGTGAFDLLSMYFHFQGNASQGLEVYETGNADNKITFMQGSPYSHNTGYNHNFGDQFLGVTSITFNHTPSTGQVRIDSLSVSPHPIPLPATGWLMLSVLGLGGLVAHRKRQQKAA